MAKEFKLTFMLILSLMISQCSNKRKSSILQAEKIEKGISNKDSVQLSFNIIPNEITYKSNSWRKLPLPILADLKLLNLGEKDLETYKTIFYGLKSEGDSHIEVLDFDNNIIEVEREMHYQYPIWEENLKVVNLETNQSKVDTIDLDAFYVFEKGIYKIRYVDQWLNVTSNWDTLKVN